MRRTAFMAVMLLSPMTVPAGSSINLRFNVNPASGNNSSAACELRGDNFKLAIVSHTPTAGGVRRVHISRVALGRPGERWRSKESQD